MKMSWDILSQAAQTGHDFSENEFVKQNQTGAFLGGGAALAAGFALGATSLPLAVPLLVISGVLAGSKGEETVKNTAKGIGSIFGDVACIITRQGL